MGQYAIVTYAETCFLQILLWERFYGIASRPVKFEGMTGVEVMVRDEREKKKSILIYLGPGGGLE